MAIALVPASTAAASADDGICVGPDSKVVPEAERALVSLTNEFRASRGLAPLARSPRLTGVARRHSTRMARLDFFGHSGSGNRFGWAKSRPAGENLALAESPAVVMSLLKGSTTHRRTLLGRYRWVGIGVFRTCTGDLLVTQDFIG